MNAAISKVKEKKKKLKAAISS